MDQEVKYWEVNSWFWDELDERRNRGKNFVGLIIGPPGIGKSCLGIEIKKQLQARWQVPYYDAPVCVFNPNQFWNYMRVGPDWCICPWDEPNKGLSHRDWYEEMNQAVVTYIQTMRFKKKNLLLMLPSSRLVDKSARAVCTFEIIMKQPGLGRVHQLIQNNFGSSPEFWKQFRGEIQLHMPDRTTMAKYDEEKEVFHKEDFPEEAFTEKPNQTPNQSRAEIELARVESLVRADPMKYRGKLASDGKSYLLNANKIEALANTSARIASKVRLRLEDEFSKTGNS